MKQDKAQPNKNADKLLKNCAFGCAVLFTIFTLVVLILYLRAL